MISSPAPPNRTDHAIFQDALGRRLRWAVAASLLVNLIFWRAAASVALHPPRREPTPVEITRVVLTPEGKKIEKVVKKEQIEKKVARAHKEIQKRRPEWKPPPPRPVHREPPPARVAKRTPPPKPTQIARTQPEGAHNRVLTARPDKNAAPPKLDEPTALAGGKANVGKPTTAQNPGDASANPAAPFKNNVPVSKAPQPAAPTPAPVAPKTGNGTDSAAPVPKKAEPEHIESPKPVEPIRKGPTRDAEPQDQIKPEIPDDLKQGNYKSFVRVKVEIAEDGSFVPILRTSSGNAEIDRRVLEALKKWRWKPALKEGTPLKTTQLFKFEFEVE